jgi:hypothetical protein
MEDRRTHMHSHTRTTARLNNGARLTLALAVGYIVAAVLYVLLAYQQPSDGWLYVSGIESAMLVAQNQSGMASPLQPGDQILAIEGRPVSTLALQPLPPPPGWRVGSHVRYTVQRGQMTLDLDVPLTTRPVTALLDYIWWADGPPGLALFRSLLWYAIGFAVFLLRPRETAARLLLLIVAYWTTYDIIFSADTSAAQVYYWPLLFWFRALVELLWPMLFAMAAHLVLAFPVRLWPLSRWPRATLLLLYGVPASGLVVMMLTGSDAIGLASLFMMMGIAVVALVATLIANLRMQRDPVTRAQASWLVLGLCGPFFTAIVLQVALYLQLVSGQGVNWLYALAALLLPISLAIAITRYRLFDIEVVIRRTLVYSTLTLALGLVYLGCVVLLQALVVPLLGSSDIAVVASTLTIAALFFPLRRRIQRLIDRRFFRRKYDAAKVLAAFAATARDETDLARLTEELQRVVGETVQPEFVGVWLKENPRT